MGFLERFGDEIHPEHGHPYGQRGSEPGPIISLRPHEIESNHIAPGRVSWGEMGGVDIAQCGL